MTYAEIIASMPYGLDKVILSRLNEHIGKENAIKRPDLLAKVHEHFDCHEVTDRQMRKIINDMRKQGILICSIASEDGGYFLAENLIEYHEFARRELGAKIADMSESLQAMDRAAKEIFGDAAQMSLI